MLPVNIRALVAPLFEIPAQTWTLCGCLGQPFIFGGSLLHRNCSFAWFSMYTEHSSVKMTWLKHTLSSRDFMANSSCFTPFGSGISWQYFVPVCTQPSFMGICLTLHSEKLQWNFSLTFLWRWGPVSLSFFFILVSMKFRTFKVTCSASQPGVGAFSKDCRSWKRLTLSCFVWHSSSVRILTISLIFLFFDRGLTSFVFCSCVEWPLVFKWINRRVSRIRNKRNWIEGVTIWIEIIVLHITQPMTFSCR